MSFGPHDQEAVTKAMQAVRALCEDGLTLRPLEAAFVLFKVVGFIYANSGSGGRLALRQGVDEFLGDLHAVDAEFPNDAEWSQS